MKKNYLKYYDAPSALARLRFMYDSLVIGKPNARIALQNRSQDYDRLIKESALMALHRSLNRRMYEAVSKGGFYDYGEGYFYQSLKTVGITGFRDTEARVASMGLVKWVDDKTVLEIGCNTGFLSICIAPFAKRVLGFDITPYLTEIGREVAEYLKVENVEFKTTSFEEFTSDARFEVVLSFANHSTYDGQTLHTIEQYFEKCSQVCVDGGFLLFESHPTAHEGDGLQHVIEEIDKRFAIEEKRVLEYGSFLDTGRTFVVARKR